MSCTFYIQGYRHCQILSVCLSVHLFFNLWSALDTHPYANCLWRCKLVWAELHVGVIDWVTPLKTKWAEKGHCQSWVIYSLLLLLGRGWGGKGSEPGSQYGLRAVMGPGEWVSQGCLQLGFQDICRDPVAVLRQQMSVNLDSIPQSP